METQDTDIQAYESPLTSSESPPSVHTLETTRHSASQPIQRLSRGKSQVLRQASALELYSRLDYSPKNSKAERLKHCRKIAYFVRHKETGLVRIALDTCKLRWCALCGSARVSWITYTVSEWLANRNQPKLATFTLQHTDEDLTFQVQRLYRFFVNLRKLPAFRSRVRGGIWFFQIKMSTMDHLWHNHLHCVIDSSYFPQGELSSTWKQITHHSYIVDIRTIRHPGKTANEVARYAACPCDLSKNTLDNNVDVLHALHGRRICGAWGTARGVTLKPPRDEHPELWENIGSRSVIMFQLETSQDAKAIYQAWQNHTILDSGINCLLKMDWMDDIVRNYQPADDGHKSGDSLWDNGSKTIR